MTQRDDLTLVLESITQADGQAGRQLLPLVYEELRRLAHDRLRHEPRQVTLQTTALVHEAYMRVMAHPDCVWNNRGHFFGSAAEAMRRILVDRARRRGRIRHGGGRERRPLDVVDPESPEPAPESVIAIDEALARLEQDDPVRAEVVKLRYFAGLSVEQTAAVVGLSTATVKRHWRVARAWLCRELLNADTGADLDRDETDG